MSANRRLSVMIAGIGGASLGTEVAKCLNMVGTYDVFGCDISANAFGHFDPSFRKTFVVNREDYVRSVVDVCRGEGCEWIVPGGERPLALLNDGVDQLTREGIGIVGNSPEIILNLSDKLQTATKLRHLGVPAPLTVVADRLDQMSSIALPCIVKPSSGTGGSDAVFLAETREEIAAYAHLIRATGRVPVAQEYIGHEEGEFTIGVVSLPDGSVAGSIGLRRSLDTKLSVKTRSGAGIISSGYSQGYIAPFTNLCAQAERIAVALGSTGPLNIQGRVRDETLIPFEINPRFSASAYLRAMAGFNEVNTLLQYLAHGRVEPRAPLREGWYLRSLTETYAAPREVSSP